MGFNFDVFGNVEHALETAPKGGMLQPGSYFNGIVERADWGVDYSGADQLKVTLSSGDTKVPGTITKYLSLNSDNEQVKEIARNELSLLAHYAGLKRCEDADDLVGARVYFDVWEQARKTDPNKIDLRIAFRGPAQKRDAVVRGSVKRQDHAETDDVVPAPKPKFAEPEAPKKKAAPKFDISDDDIPF